MQWKLPGIYEKEPSKIPSNGRHKPNRQVFLFVHLFVCLLVGFCSKARLPVKGLGHEHTLTTFDLQFFLPMRCDMAQKLGEWPIDDWSILRPMPWEGVHPDYVMTGWIDQRSRIEANTTGKTKSMKWFLMVFCQIYRQEPSIVIIQEASTSNWLKPTPPVFLFIFYFVVYKRKRQVVHMKH